MKLKLNLIIIYFFLESIKTLAFSPGSLKNEIIRRKSPPVAKSGTLASVVESVEKTDKSSGKSITSLLDTFPIFSVPLASLGFATPTPIQAVSAQRALEDENLLLIAPTGSGKTLAYFLPALSKCFDADKTVLVVAPTRELALQLRKDAMSLLKSFSDDVQSGVLLAIKGVEAPTPKELRMATMLVGTPPELYTVLTTIDNGYDFVSGKSLSTVIMDEVDILLPPPPKMLRTGLDVKKKNKKTKNSPQDDRRKQEQKRKLMAMKRNGIEIDSAQDLVTPTEKILKIIASNRLVGGLKNVPPAQVLAGSATASRKTLDRLNRSLRNAAAEAAVPYNLIWNGDTKACRPKEDSEGSTDSMQDTLGKKEEKQHTIRAVTVPPQVKHKYIEMSKESASQATEVLKSLATVANVLKPKLALVFLCGEFSKAKSKATAAPKFVAKGATSKARRTSIFKQKKLASKFLAKEKAKDGKGPAPSLSARKACSILNEQGIAAKPLHVALGLEMEKSQDTSVKDDSPEFLVTFEGSSRGLHFDDVDAVFVVGRPASAASYLHLSGRVGRSSGDNGSIVVRPGTIVSFCTKGSVVELQKWTKQVGGDLLEEIEV